MTSSFIKDHSLAIASMTTVRTYQIMALISGLRQ